MRADDDGSGSVITRDCLPGSGGKKTPLVPLLESEGGWFEMKLGSSGRRENKFSLIVIGVTGFFFFVGARPIPRVIHY